MNNVVPNLERSNTFTGYGTIQCLMCHALDGVMVHGLQFRQSCNFFASLMPSAWHSVTSLYRLLAWLIVRWGEDGPDVNTPACQVPDTWLDPARLGMLGMRLLGPATGCPGRWKLGLV